MAGEFRLVSTARLWSDGRMRALRRRCRDAHDLLLYLLTCPEGNFIGLAAVPSAHIAGDIVWPEARVRKAFEVLEIEGLAFYDFQAQVVYLPLVLEWQPLETDRQARGAIRRLETLPPSPLIGHFKQAICSLAAPAKGKARDLLLAHFNLTPMPSESRSNGIYESHSNGIRTQALAPDPAPTQALAPDPAPAPLDGPRPLSAAEEGKVKAWLRTINRTPPDRREQMTRDALTALRQALKMPEEQVRRIMQEAGR